ncbi:MAG: rod shape-determining protein MreD [Proteobacteria bacterium]|nr:rod shape-determining protein MreD [Pseudomonadota bacterium]
MKLGFVFLALGGLGLVVQGVLAELVSPRWSPDLSLLVLVAMAYHWRPAASGYVLAATLGYATDLLSGSLLGQHALLRVATFAGARLASRQLDLRGTLPLAVFVAGVTLLYGLGLFWSSDFFAGEAGLSWGGVGGVLGHALVNAVAAPFVAAGVGRVAQWTVEEDPNRVVRLDPERGRP